MDDHTAMADMTKICCIIVGLILSVADCNEPGNGNNTEGKRFSLEEAVGNAFTANTFQGRWVSDHEFIYKDSSLQTLQLHDVEKNTESTIVPWGYMTSKAIEAFWLSPDQQFVLLLSDTHQAFGHSVTAKYWIYDRTTRNLNILAGGEGLQLAKWSTVGNGLAYVLKNNISYASRVKDVLSSGAVQLTDDGIDNVVYNGVPDFIYGEEVFKDQCALWFSPKGNYLVYASFNDINVESTTFKLFDDPENDGVSYSEVFTLRYPKVDKKNPDVVLKYVDLHSTNLQARSLPAPPVEIIGRDYILNHVSWANDDQVIAIWTNRIQNRGQMMIYKMSNPDRPIYMTDTEFFVPWGWLSPMVVKHHPTSNKLYLILSVDASWRFSQIYEYQWSNTSVSYMPLTTPKQDVVEIYGVDAAGYVYCQTTGYEQASHRQVYRLQKNRADCISCDDGCEYASASFSLNLSYVALTCSGPGVPRVKLYRTRDLTVVRDWENNAALSQKLDEYQLPRQLDTDIVVAGNFPVKVRLLLPPGLQENGTAQYPMIVRVNDAPETQLIHNNFQVGWEHYLATNRSYICALVDGHGSGFRGDDVRFSVYRQLGTVEVQDHLDVTRELVNRYPFIDGNRTGIWGRGHGGYTAAMVLGKDTDGLYKCGVSVSPIAKWIHHASFYTERYMASRRDGNLAGYNNADLTKHLENFQNDQFLLIHATADRTFHPEHSMLLAAALQARGVTFLQQSYPNEDHSLGWKKVHMYETQDAFWSRCFQEDPAAPPCPTSTATRGTATLAALLLFLLLLLDQQRPNRLYSDL